YGWVVLGGKDAGAELIGTGQVIARAVALVAPVESAVDTDRPPAKIRIVRERAIDVLFAGANARRGVLAVEAAIRVAGERTSLALLDVRVLGEDVGDVAIRKYVQIGALALLPGLDDAVATDGRRA